MVIVGECRAGQMVTKKFLVTIFLGVFLTTHTYCVSADVHDEIVAHYAGTASYQYPVFEPSYNNYIKRLTKVWPSENKYKTADGVRLTLGTAKKFFDLSFDEDNNLIVRTDILAKTRFAGGLVVRNYDKKGSGIVKMFDTASSLNSYNLFLFSAPQSNVANPRNLVCIHSSSANLTEKKISIAFRGSGTFSSELETGFDKSIIVNTTRVTRNLTPPNQAVSWDEARWPQLSGSYESGLPIINSLNLGETTEARLEFMTASLQNSGHLKQEHYSQELAIKALVAPEIVTKRIIQKYPFTKKGSTICLSIAKTLSHAITYDHLPD